MQRAILVVVLVSSILIATHTVQGAEPWQWAALPSSGAVPLNGPAGAYLPPNEAVMVFGMDSQTSPHTLVFDATTNEWFDMTTQTIPPPRSLAAMVYDPGSDFLILHGGRNPGGGTMEDMWGYDRNERDWTPLSGGGGTPREEHTLLYDYTTGRLVLFGGYDNNTGTFFDETWWFIRRVGWVPLDTSTPPAARRGHAAVIEPGTSRMFVFGGETADGVLLNDLHVLNLESGRWQTLPSPPEQLVPRRKPGFTYNPTTNSLLVFGGLDANGYPLDDTWSYQLLTGEWTQTSSSPPPPRWAPVLCHDKPRNRMILFGGLSAPWADQQGDSAQSRDLLADTWELGLPIVPNSSCSGAIALPALNTTTAGDTTNATADYTMSAAASCTGYTTAGRDVAYSFQVSQPMILDASL